MANTAMKMRCPRCGAEMNHHGDKLVYTPGGAEDHNVDSGLGGRLEEFHTCPRCGASASRLVLD
jgi:ribosomal protein S27AE